MEDVVVDSAARTVTVGAGVTYGKLSPILHDKGFALTQSGFVAAHFPWRERAAQPTHGSGEKNGSLATGVAALEFVTADGEVVKLFPAQKDGADFPRRGGWTWRHRGDYQHHAWMCSPRS